ncbi:MAG TPA: hypothetical protein VIM61_11120 [Chthoniobacterales bacterium]|jgi:hypothetical protein
MKRFSLLAAFAFLTGTTGLLAQQSPQGGNNNDNGNRQARPAAVSIWRAELPGGSFAVARNAIVGISTQQYILDGAARVTEVNIIVTGPFQPRFYYLEPLPAATGSALPGASAAAVAKDRAQDLANRAVPGDPIWAKVVKNYPTTTHAGTIEFRLETQEQLDALYASVNRTWTTGKGETFTPAGTTPYHTKKKSEDGENGDQDAASPDSASLPGTEN